MGIYLYLSGLFSFQNKTEKDADNNNNDKKTLAFNAIW